MRFHSMIAFVTATAVIVAAGVAAERPELPAFCRGKDCPHFEVVKKADEYEVRRYDTTTWIGFNTTGLKFELAMGRAFAGLARYFNGANDQEMKLNITTPYITKMLLEEAGGYETINNYTIALMVPEKFQTDPPRPTLDTQHLFTVKAETMYVRSVKGFATEGTFKEEHNKLRDALKMDGAPFHDDLFFSAVYDPPQRLTDRYNEVMMVAKDVVTA